MLRTARLAVIGAMCAAALATGVSTASAATGSSGTGSSGTGSGTVDLGSGSYSIWYLLEQALISSGSATRCQLGSTDDPTCFIH